MFTLAKSATEDVVIASLIGAVIVCFVLLWMWSAWKRHRNTLSVAGGKAKDAGIVGGVLLLSILWGAAPIALAVFLGLVLYRCVMG